MTGSASGKVRVGCQANAWQREMKLQDSRENLEEALRQMANAGYEGAELPLWSIPDLDRPDEVRDLLARHHLAFIAIHVGGNFYEDAPFRDQTLPTAQRAARCAAAAGAESIVLSASAKRAPVTTVPFDAVRPHSPSPTTHARKDANDLRVQRDNLAAVARFNHDLGLTTHYHNHIAEFEDDCHELRSILEVDPSHLSLCFDIGNAARPLSGPALVATMERFWDRIGYLHFKDIMGDTLAESLGEGEIDFAPIGALARQRGFHGWASAEIEPAKGMVAHRSVAEDARLSAHFIRTTLGR